MANSNLKSIQRIVNKLGLKAQIIPNPNNPLNCSKILIQGQELKCSQWSSIEAETRLSDFVEGCYDCDIDTRSGEELIKDFIVFDDKPFNTCLIEFINLNLNDKSTSITAWLTQLYNFYNINEDNKIIDYDFNSKNYALYILMHGDVALYKGHLFTQKGLEYLVQAWYNSNNTDRIKLEKAQEISYNILKKLKSLNF